MSYEFKFILSNILWISIIILGISLMILTIYYYNSKEKDRFGEELSNLEQYVFNNFKKLLIIISFITGSLFFINIIMSIIYRMFLK